MAKPVHDLPFPALEGLLGPLSLRAFFDQWWERAPGLLPARSTADRESFRRQDWRELAQAARGLNDVAVEVLEGGRPQKPGSEGRIDAGFSAGASVRILRVQRVWPFLNELCRALMWELGFRVSANMYVTPEGRQGLDIHADSHDVIVVQMAGGKDWEIFGSPYPLPIDYRAPLVFEDGVRRDHRGDEFGGRGHKGRDVGPPVLTCSLSPGDLLYIPRGFVHQAVASHGTSVHVTIGIHATTWGDLLALAVAQESRTESALRETLPPGATRVAPAQTFIEAELRERGSRLLERIHGEALMLETASRFAAATAPSNQAGAATDGDHAAERAGEAAAAGGEGPGLPAFDPSGHYELSHHAYINLRSQEIDVRSLRAPGAVHTFPAFFKAVFDALSQGRTVSASTLAPMTTRSGEVFLLRLLKAGILVPAATEVQASARPQPSEL